jgi:hypothetical protein
VSADLIGVWRVGWQTAARMQHENPALRAIALQSPAEPDAAMEALVPVLAYTHPRFQATVLSVLDLAISELDAAAREGVTPPRDNPTRDGEHAFADDGDTDVERDVGGGQQQDRAVDEWEARFERLEAWHADLEDEVVRLRGLLAELGAAAQTVRPTNTL